MNLRTRTWIAVGIALAGVIAPLLLLFAYLIGADFDRLAGELSRLHVRRVVELVAHQQHSLGVLARDWGEWDDTYRFLEDRNQGFTDSNLTDDINESTETDLLLILDLEGRQAAAATSPRPESEELLRLLHDAVVGLKFTVPETDAVRTGLVATPYGPLLFGASPVLTSHNEGPNRGAMVMARLVDAPLMAQWRELVQGEFSLLGDGATEEGLTREERQMLERGEVAMGKRRDEMVGYARLTDYRGRPAYLIRAGTQQAVYRHGRTTLVVSSLLLFLALLLFAVVTAVLLERSVFSRLTRLDRAVKRIGEKEEEREGPVVAIAASDDEIGRLAGTIDAMVGELTRSLHEKEVLLREIHHRVKNNMQVISSLLSMQAQGCEEPLTRHALQESRNRIYSMSLVHEKLYHTEQFTRLDFAEYLRSLASAIASSSGAMAERIRLRFELEPLEVGLDTAIYCGLVTNELITNAFEHAFPEGRSGELRIVLRRGDEGAVELEVGDDGVGLGVDCEPRKGDTLGLRLVRNLVEYQLRGTLEVACEEGATFRIRFPGASHP